MCECKYYSKSFKTLLWSVTSAQAVLASMRVTSSGRGTASGYVKTSLATRQVLNWVLRKLAAWPIHRIATQLIY